jgi:hypothetical protein
MDTIARNWIQKARKMVGTYCPGPGSVREGVWRWDMDSQAEPIYTAYSKKFSLYTALSE